MGRFSLDLKNKGDYDEVDDDDDEVDDDDDYDDDYDDDNDDDNYDDYDDGGSHKTRVRSSTTIQLAIDNDSVSPWW